MKEIKINESKACQGVFFRGYSSTFWQRDNKIGRHEGLRFLVRKSCKGGHEGLCRLNLFDNMDCEIDCGSLRLPDAIEHGGLYEMVVTNVTRDWESGHIDGYDIEFIKVKDS